MKKVVILVILFSVKIALAANPADVTVNYRLMPKLFCLSYDEDATRSVFAALPFKDSMITMFNRTKEKEAKSYLVFANQFSSWIDGGLKAELVQDRNDESVKMNQEIGLDLHKGAFGLGAAIPFQGQNTMLGLRVENEYLTNYIYYEAKGWWNFGLDLKLKGFKSEFSYNEDEELYVGISYSVKTPWGYFVPSVFSDNDVLGGKLLLIY